MGHFCLKKKGLSENSMIALIHKLSSTIVVATIK